MAAFTAVFNITGQPAVSLPLHVAPSGLPVGVQIVAGPWREAQLVRVAAQLEAGRSLGRALPRVRLTSDRGGPVDRRAGGRCGDYPYPGPSRPPRAVVTRF